MDQQDRILAAALEYCAYGWRVLPLRNGKIPRLKAWQMAASKDPDTVRGWWRQWPDSNVGVKLGPDSGIIDVECDSDEAEAGLSALFDGRFPNTPTWQSSRGKHRLFVYRPDLPAPEKNGFKIVGAEFRTGNGGKGAQSVFPPSRHPSGVDYRWLISPVDCPIAEIDQIVYSRLWNWENEDLLGMAPECIDLKERARRYLAKFAPAVSGQNGSVPTYRAACVLVLGFAFSTDEAMPLLREYSERCEPPWSDKELRHKLDDAAKEPGERGYLLNKQAVGATPLGRDKEAHAHIGEVIDDLRDLFNANSIERTWKALTEWNSRNLMVSASSLQEMFEEVLQSRRADRANEHFGEPFSVDRSFHPTDNADDEDKPIWKLVIVESKPRSYKLWSPLWSSKASEGYIELTSSDMLNANAIRHQALEQADVWVSRVFCKLWEGDKTSPSLAKELMVSAAYEPAALESKRDMLVASLLYEKLLTCDTKKCEDGLDPLERYNGWPCRLENKEGKPGDIVFMFRKVFEDLAMGSFKIKERELSRILEKLGVEERTYGGKGRRRNMKVLSNENLLKLRRWIRVMDT